MICEMWSIFVVGCNWLLMRSDTLGSCIGVEICFGHSSESVGTNCCAIEIS